MAQRAASLNEGLPGEGQRRAGLRRPPGPRSRLNEGLPGEGQRQPPAGSVRVEGHTASTKGCPVKGSDDDRRARLRLVTGPQRRAAR